MFRQTVAGFCWPLLCRCFPPHIVVSCACSRRRLFWLVHFAAKITRDKDFSSTALTLGGVLRYIGRHKPKWFILENVPLFKVIMGKVVQILGKKGYATNSCNICPSDVCIPATRRRIYLAGKYDPSAINLSLVSFEQTSKVFIAMAQAKYKINMKQFLLDLRGPIMQMWLSDLRRSKPGNDGEKWPDKHDTVFQSHGLKRPSLRTMQEFIQSKTTCEAQATMFNSLTMREQEAVYFVYRQAKYERLQVPMGRDISQSIDRLTNATDTVSCLTGSSIHWLFELQGGEGLWRRLMGEEAMALQGLTHHHLQNIREFSNKTLLSLAGNAFNLPCYCLVVLSLLMS